MDTDTFAFKLFLFFLKIAIVYAVGAFIAFDPNPLNWLLFTRWWGRLILLFLFIGIIKSSFFEEY